MDRDGSVLQSGGFIIQLMPDVPDEVITQLENNLRTLASVTEMLSAGDPPEDILCKVLAGLDPVISDKADAEWYCNCSKERYAKGLISLGKEELGRLIDEDGSIEVRCRFCNTPYTFDADEMQEMLTYAK